MCFPMLQARKAEGAATMKARSLLDEGGLNPRATVGKDVASRWDPVNRDTLYKKFWDKGKESFKGGGLRGETCQLEKQIGKGDVNLILVSLGESTRFTPRCFFGI